MFGDRNWHRILRVPLFSIVLFCSSFNAPIVLAQLIPDTSLGDENSTVTEDATVKNTAADLIQGGASRGENLFHSFQEFNVNPNQQVYFANPDGIANIITRVTGNNSSEILGRLGVDGAENLFLLNPNGIVFGENSTLDVNGAFLATTAQSYIFSDGSEYSAIAPDAPPLLAINLPVGIQFGSNNKRIAVQGTGHQLNFDFTSLSPNINFRHPGLAVGEGNTLALIGGEVDIQAGNLTTSAGRIELGSVAQSGTVGLEIVNGDLVFDYTQTNSFGNIELEESSSLDVSGDRSGSIRLQGKDISLTGKSVILAYTEGSEEGGEIEINASDTLEIIGSSTGDFPSGIFTKVEPEATGKGSNLKIAAETLNILNNAFILSSTAGASDGGEIEIIAKQGNFSDRSSPFFGTGIFSLAQPESMGNGGNIALEFDALTIGNGGEIDLATSGEGNGGELLLNTSELEIFGTSAFLNFPSAISTSVATSSATGNGGKINLTSDRLLLASGGKISSNTKGIGNGGESSIQTEDLEITGASAEFGFPSIIETAVAQTEATGRGGNLTIDTQKLLLTDGGRISSGTSGIGNGGHLFLNADNIQVLGTSANFGFPSFIFTSVIQPQATGMGGDLTINTNNLLLQDGGGINLSTIGEGDSGNLFLNATNTQIYGATSGIFANTSGDNEGGNIAVNGEQLIVESGSVIDASTFGRGDSGSLTVDVDRLQIIDGAKITTSTFDRGDAGNITVNISESIEISGVNITDNGESVLKLSSSGLFASVESGATGDGGNLIIETPRLQVSEGGKISANTLGRGNGGEISIVAQDIEISDSIVTSDLARSGVTSSVEPQGEGDAGSIIIMANNLRIIDGGSIAVDATGEGDAGSIIIDAANLEVKGALSPDLIIELEQIALPSSISAFSQGKSSSGTVELNANTLQVLDGADISVSNLEQGDAGNINITASKLILDRGGKLSAAVNTGIQGNIALSTDDITISNQSIINTEATGTATSGNIGIQNTNTITLNSSQIIADAEQGNAGSIQITTKGLFASPDSVIRANSKLGIDGTVEVSSLDISRNLGLASLPQTPLSKDLELTQGCDLRGNNHFAYVGRGGLPATPLNSISTNSFLPDLGSISSLKSPLSNFDLTSASYSSYKDSSDRDVVEAQAWKLNLQGKIELVASKSDNFKLPENSYLCGKQARLF